MLHLESIGWCKPENEIQTNKLSKIDQKTSHLNQLLFIQYTPLSMCSLNIDVRSTKNFVGISFQNNVEYENIQLNFIVHENK